jgi:hypothetical protein
MPDAVHDRTAKRAADVRPMAPYFPQARCSPNIHSNTPPNAYSICYLYFVALFSHTPDWGFRSGAHHGTGTPCGFCNSACRRPWFCAASILTNTNRRIVKLHLSIWVLGAGLVPYDFANPKYWFDRAKEMRSRAELMRDLHNKEIMHRIADDYERLGRRAMERQATE